MKYSTYLETLETALKTGKSNKAEADSQKQAIYPALADKLEAAGGLKDKDAKSLKAAINALYAICAGSPLLEETNTGLSLSVLLRQSAESPDPAQLPLILSGPMLRRTEPEAVTVWVALSQAEDVVLSVFEDQDGRDGNQVLTGSLATVKLGEHLHVVAVTAKPLAAGGPVLEYGKSYLYTLQFNRRQQSLPDLMTKEQL